MAIIPELDDFESSSEIRVHNDNDIGEKLRQEIRKLMENEEFSSRKSDLDGMTELIMNKLAQVAE